MAIQDDFSIATSGDIRHVSGTTTYTVLAFHRWLQDYADDQQASGNDLLDITSETPSDRSTDNIITLVDHSATSGPTYNIDDDASQYLYAGSISQNGGNTLYAGVDVVGGVNSTLTQLFVIQDNQLYAFTTDPDAPYWGDQSSGGYNGDSASGVLMRLMLKVRDNGADIDGKRLRLQARHWGDTYDFFNVTTGQGISVAAISTTPDAQNDTDRAAVNLYTHVINSGGTAAAPTGGYQQIDLNNGNGNQPYYSAWTYGADTSGDGLKGMWERLKDISGHGSVLIDAQDELSYDNSPTTEGSFVGGTGYSTSDTLTLSDGSTLTVDNQTGGVVDQFTIDATTSTGSIKPGDVLTATGGTGGNDFTLTPDDDNLRAARTIDSLDGQLFIGPSHSWDYDNLSGTYTEQETVVWGTELVYDTLAGGTFAAGNYVTIGASGAAGRLVYDNGTTTLKVALDDTSITVLDDDVITEYDSIAGTGATGVTAAVNVTITDNDKSGGTGLLLADDTTDTLWIQLLTGSAPVDNIEVRGISSAATSDVNGSPTIRTQSKTFMGSYTGSVIGAYGLGISSSDLTASDTITPLVGVTQTPPNNVTFTVSGLIIGEDRVLVAPRDTTVIDFDQLILNTTLSGANEASVVATASIPTDSPSAGTIRVELDSGIYKYVRYESFATATFTIITDSTFVDGDVTVGTDQVTQTAHSFRTGDHVQLTSSGTLPGGLALATDYYLIIVDANEIKFAASLADAYAGTEVTITSAAGGGTHTINMQDQDFSGDNATSSNFIFISYIDKLAEAASETFTVVYLSDRDLFVRVRDGGATPIKTFESTSATLTSTGGSVGAIRTTDA